MNAQHYLAITGGVGGAKLALGLARILAADELAVAVNTGDDFRHLGLYVAPDIDTLTYTLAGKNNPDTGWGRREETWNFMSALAELGGETWFSLGDRDLALNVLRTYRMGQGQSLSEVTSRVARAFGVEHEILPMSDDPVSTRVLTDAGEMAFQHYFVRERCQPEVRGFRFAGADEARLHPGIVARLKSGRLGGVILCPSNPFVSIDPILAVPGLRDLLGGVDAPVIAVSPVVGGTAIKGPTVKMMGELGVPNSAAWVAEHYRDFLDGFVLDAADVPLAAEIETPELKVSITDTVMETLQDRIDLARHCLDLLDSLRGAR